MRILTCSTPLLAAALLVAQDPSPSVAPPASAAPPPHLRIETVGPDGWRARFGPTNLGSMLESEKGRALWQPGVTPLLATWESLAGAAQPFADVRARLLGYSGRVRVAAWLANLDGDPVFERAVLVLDGDGKTDMQALAADVRSLQGNLEGEWQQVELDGAAVTQEARVFREDVMTTPRLVDGRLLVLLARGGGLAETFAAGKAFAAKELAKPATVAGPAAPALRVELDLAALVALGAAEADEDERALVTALGLPSLGTLTWTVGTAGPHVMAELAHTFAQDPAGLFAALCPASNGVPELQRLVAGDRHPTWKVGHFDFRALFDTFVAVFESLEFGPDEGIRASMRKELGMDVADDLIAHATDEVLLLGSPLRGLDRPGDLTWVFVVRLRDEAKFAAGLATMLDNSRPFLQREAEVKVGDVALRRHGNMLGYDVWFATGHGLFLFAGGRDAEEELTALVKAAAVPPPADAPKPPPLPAGFGPLKGFLPPGHSGLARADLGGVVGLPTEWWLMALAELIPFGGFRNEVDEDPDQREAVQALLRHHNLDVVHTATGRQERTWRWRLFW